MIGKLLARINGEDSKGSLLSLEEVPEHFRHYFAETPSQNSAILEKDQEAIWPSKVFDLKNIANIVKRASYWENLQKPENEILRIAYSDSNELFDSVPDQRKSYLLKVLSTITEKLWQDDKKLGFCFDTPIIRKDKILLVHMILEKESEQLYVYKHPKNEGYKGEPFCFRWIVKKGGKPSYIKFDETLKQELSKIFFTEIKKMDFISLFSSRVERSENERGILFMYYKNPNWDATKIYIETRKLPKMLDKPEEDRGIVQRVIHNYHSTYIKIGKRLFDLTIHPGSKLGYYIDEMGLIFENPW